MGGTIEPIWSTLGDPDRFANAVVVQESERLKRLVGFERIYWARVYSSAADADSSNTPMRRNFS